MSAADLMSPMSSLGMDNLGTERRLETMFSDEARPIDKFQAEEGGFWWIWGLLGVLGDFGRG